ncbi:MAG: SoxXA-binding protein [endosymbiont of Galathealinum brachiosum]|uniref:SoxXA-binding protein n=1 Tax=endosymbiont of Galathealinum brachiosum TaxID=2200906 RepID=A0A370DL37_9GAMM|nr:MAG: SoxXA-binding protein [endosymbiont of Galathealinum brachiosum]
MRLFMNHAKIFAGIALATVLLSGCATSGSSGNSAAATKEGYNAALVNANKSLKAAAQANYVWRDSGKMLKKADKAAKKGDFETATKLANQAKRQGDMALAQSKEQAGAGPR